LTNFLGVIGYWASAYVAIIVAEHLYFRKKDPSLYDVSAWNVPKRLPSGIAAVTAGVLSFGMVIPSMSQKWFTGPIARTTGDIGFEVAFVVSGLLYFPFRWLEIRWRGFV
jgi:purine-cytosine permease-like protein